MHRFIPQWFEFRSIEKETTAKQQYFDFFKAKMLDYISLLTFFPPSSARRHMHAFTSRLTFDWTDSAASIISLCLVENRRFIC